MTRYLFDTNALLFVISRSDKLAADRVMAIGTSPRYASQVCAIEIAIKHGLGRLDLPPPFQIGFANAFSRIMDDLGLDLLPIEMNHIQAFANLPLHHRDPFDRLIIAQALTENLTVVTRDRSFRLYPGLDVYENLTMQPFTELHAKAAPLDLANLDTDQIIPKQFLKTVEREGLAKGLFYDLRFDADGKPKPDFVLNDPRYAGAGVLIAGDNFGCGSSREHAAWALLDYGVRCVIAPSFADIFYGNCMQNGVLPVALPESAVRALMEEAKGGNHVFAIDLASQTVTSPSGQTFRFDIDPSHKAKLLNGLDAIGETLQSAKDIDVYEMRQALAQPWLERT